MAKNITKTVIEDIAYELKNTGLWLERANNTDSLEDWQVDFTNPYELLDCLIKDLEEVMVKHDPTFNVERWTQQTAYRIEE